MTDILFTAWNRRRFTEASFDALLRNTNWDRVSALHVHDDASEDGTNEYLQAAIERVPSDVLVRFESMRLGSPVVVMNRYFARPDKSKWVAKIDNDCCVPPGWLDALLTVRDTTDGVDVVGMEAGMTAVPNRGEPWDGVYRLQECTHTGGIGLIRTGAFASPMEARGRYGFGDYQVNRGLHRGWITPDLPLVLLDRLPFEPWLSLSLGYEAAEWQRPWPKWDETWMAWAWQPFVGHLEGATPEPVAA